MTKDFQVDNKRTKKILQTIYSRQQKTKKLLLIQKKVFYKQQKMITKLKLRKK